MRAFSSLCTSCVHQHKKIACNPCQYLEDVSMLKKISFFEFFCMEARYDIDHKLLNKQFKLYQTFIHPDRFEIAESKGLKDRAHELSAFANNAFTTLADDI